MSYNFWKTEMCGWKKKPTQFISGLIPNPLLAEIHGKALKLFLRRGKHKLSPYMKYLWRVR